MPELDNKQQKHQSLSNGRIRDKKNFKYKQKLTDYGINKFTTIKSVLVPELDATLSA
jgi:hypothetical protein